MPKRSGVAPEHCHRPYASVVRGAVIQAAIVAGKLNGNCRKKLSGSGRPRSLTRRPTAGSRPRSRRSGIADVQSGSVRRAAMSESVASHIFHLRPWEQCSTDGRTTENGLARLSSRDVSENSNARVVRTPVCSTIIAASEPATEEIFSPVSGL